MTLTDLELCRAIARKDGWQPAPNMKWADDLDAELWWRPDPRAGEPPIPIPHYLTEPAETVRMSKELMIHGYWPVCHWQPNGYQWHHKNRPNGVQADFYERTTAEAYLAMETSE